MYMKRLADLPKRPFNKKEAELELKSMPGYRTHGTSIQTEGIHLREVYVFFLGTK